MTCKYFSSFKMSLNGLAFYEVATVFRTVPSRKIVGALNYYDFTKTIHRVFFKLSNVLKSCRFK